MKQEGWVCKKCGGRKSLVYQRSLRAVFAGLLLLAGLLVARQYMEQSVLNFLVSYVWLALAVVVSAFRIRCFDCELEWQNRVWWKLSN